MNCPVPAISPYSHKTVFPNGVYLVLKKKKLLKQSPGFELITTKIMRYLPKKFIKLLI